MYRKLLPLSVFVAALTILAAASRTTPVAAAAPITAGTTTTAVETFWRCPSGYAFETSGSAVHCKKPSWTETKPFMACGIPTPNLKVDLVSQTDMCEGVVGTTISAEPQCYPSDVLNGFTKRHVAGKDFCAKPHAAEVLPPNQAVTI